MIYNKEMKKLRNFIFCIKLCHKKKNKCLKFQIDQIKYRATTSICLFNVLECHYRDMGWPQPN